MNRYTPNNFGFLIPDQDGAWIRHIEVAALERKIAELEATAVINTRYCAEVIERCARACEKRAEERFADHGIREHDTGATYYKGSCSDEYEIQDEEDAECAKAIRALSPITKDTK